MLDFLHRMLVGFFNVFPFWGEEHSLPVCFPNDACMPYLPTCGLKFMVNVGKSSIQAAFGFDSPFCSHPKKVPGKRDVFLLPSFQNLRAKYPPGKSEGEE